MRASGSNAKTGEGRAFEAMRGWTRRSAAELTAWLAPNMHSVRAHKPFSDLPTTSAPDGYARAAVALERVHAAGLDVLYCDYAPPGGGFACGKVIAPGLEVETMSYHRIGARNARKLIDRGHPLIRFGAPTGTLRPVRLTPEDEERLGRPLFDTALADAIVGPLYPLYREPEAHHVAASLEPAAA